MSGTQTNTKVIPLPFPRPTKAGEGWSRTWRLSLCTPAENESLGMLRASVANVGFSASVEQRSEAAVDVTIHYSTNEDPFSDENFVVRPREMLLLVEANLGRIAQIEGVARTLWPPFRPQFSVLVSTQTRREEVLQQHVR